LKGKEIIMQEDTRSQLKDRLCAMVKAAVSGLVVAAATLNTPAAEAPKPTATETSLEKRVEEVRKQNVLTTDNAADTDDAVAAFHNWGNHWHNWGNWNNWHNWHNHH
jgi:rSAM-associated Gly-rich repeat protein